MDDRIEPDLNPVNGYIHSIETGGTVDGPGWRYVLFLAGCPLSCMYCHNPDCMKMKNGVIRSVDDVLTDIYEYRTFLERTGGGVTISGGEPLAQSQFTKTLLRGCKDMGLHTALDTSGFMGSLADDELLDNADLVLLDIKSGLPETYKRVTGVPLEPTLEFAARLSERNHPMWLRFVLVPGLTDAPENVEAVAKIAAYLNNIQRIDILPFHKMGEYKWEMMGMPYLLKDTDEPTQADIDRAKAIFTAHGLEVH